MIQYSRTDKDLEPKKTRTYSTHSHMDKTDIRTDRQTDRQTYTLTDRHTECGR